jgi:hypothetical protein
MADGEKVRGSATQAQLDYLILLGVPFEQPISRFAASNLISRAVLARRRDPATPRQEHFLTQRGRWRAQMTLSEASDLIGQIIAEERGRAGR